MADTPGTGLTGEQERLAEQGRPLPAAPIPAPPGAGGLPPNNGLWVVPHFETFAAVWNTVSRTYRFTYDEAMRHSRQNALAYRRDIVVREAINARKMPVAGLEWHIEPRNDMDMGDVDHARKVQETIEDTPNLQRLFFYLLEAMWYGRYGAALTYDWDWSRGYRRAVVTQHEPINGDKLVFRYSGELGILVGANYQGAWIPTERGRCHVYSPGERQTIILHQFEVDDADFYDGEMAGRIMGVGVRDSLYWFLYLKQRVMAWLMEFLERVGAGGLTIYYYETGNQASLAEVQDAAEKQKNNNAILFPRYTDGKSGPGIERIEPSEAGAQLLFSLMNDYFDRNIRRFILGQSLSSEAGGTGLGSGVAEFQQQTLNDILKYDARNLQESLTRDFVATVSRHIDPGRAVPWFAFDVDRPNAAEHLQAAQALFEMGADLDEDDLRGVLGLEKPRPGAQILSRYGPLGKQGAMMAAGMGQVGMNSPAEGNMPGGISPVNQTVLPGNLIPGDPVAQPMGYDPRRDLFAAILGGMV